MGREWRDFPAPLAALAIVGLVACGSAAADPVVPDDPNGGGTGDPPPAAYCADVPTGVLHAATGEPGANPSAEGTPRIVAMGGSSEVNPASKLFVEAAGGGDVLVMRASGSVTSYNNYFMSSVGPVPPPASVASIRIDDPAQSLSEGVLCHVRRTSALWLAGGNQWNYLGVWPVEMQDSIAAVGRRGGIGGTSAGAAVLGEFAFDARNGGVTSAEALQDPFGPRVQVSRSAIGQPEFAGWIVDQHFRERDREGRLLVFMARMQLELDRDTVYAVGLDERAALVVEGDRFEVLANPERAAVFYRVTERTAIAPGQPFDMTGIERVVLESGANGPWPLDFDAYPRERLRVEGGTVEILP
jgi:cyanophycinase